MRSAPFLLLFGLSFDAQCWATFALSSPSPSPPSSSSTPRVIKTRLTASEILDAARDEHRKEVREGIEFFTATASADGEKNDSSLSISRAEDEGQTSAAAASSESSWKDDDFVSYSVGRGNAGPDEPELGGRGHEVFRTVEPVISSRECEELVAEARDAIRTGLRELDEEGGNDRQNRDKGNPTNSELGEARVSTLPKAKIWLEEKMRKTFFPLLESRFGIPAGDLCLYDALIIGYGYFGGPSRSQPVHRDSSILSLNVALSPPSDYVGGGTYFEGIQDTPRIEMEQGTVLCHSGIL